MTISHVHCQVADLPAAIRWFGKCCDATPTFSDARMGVLPFGSFVLILDSAPNDSVATIGFNSVDCDADFSAIVGRSAEALEAPQNKVCRARSRSSSSRCWSPTRELEGINQRGFDEDRPSTCSVTRRASSVDG